MRIMNKLLAMLIVFTLIVGCSTAAFAEDTVTEPQTGTVEEPSVDAVDENAPAETDENLEEETQAGKGQLKPWKVERNIVKQERAEIGVLKDAVEKQIEDLELALEQATASGDTVLIDSLKGQIATLAIQNDAYRTEMKQKIEEMKQIIRSKYSEAELEQLSIVGESLSSEENVQVLPVENIFVKDKDVKFDMPPVIKQGRTLIPVRAIAESTGATVDWNGDDQTVTIVKDDKTIVFNLGEDKVYVDGVETEIDIPAEVMNNRTMVPMRFIAENLGLKVTWDQETQTIEISDEAQI